VARRLPAFVILFSAG